MLIKRPQRYQPPERPRKAQKQGNPVSKATQVASKRIGGALRAEHARQQARRDAKR